MRAKRCKRIVLNVSGEIFETFEKTLNRFPETLLGGLDKRRPYYSCATKQHYFNRSRQCFGAILFFYQSNGILRCPPGMAIDIFEEECEFFQIPEELIYVMKTKEGILPELQNVDTGGDRSGTLRARMWNVLENPETSTSAWVFTIISLTAILISILSAILETVKQLRFTSHRIEENPWAITELVLNSWFLLELLARFISSPSKKEFVECSLNWIDATAIVPYFIMLVFTPDKISSFGFLRILRLIRVIRLFRLSKHSKRLQIVGIIIKSSFGDFQLLLVCLCMLVTLGGSAMYYVEGSPTSDFSSIPNSLWWGIVTITTVGYGDIVPITLVGKLLSAGFMAFGALTITLPVLSIVTKFMLLYEKNVEGNMVAL